MNAESYGRLMEIELIQHFSSKLKCKLNKQFSVYLLRNAQMTVKRSTSHQGRTGDAAAPRALKTIIWFNMIHLVMTLI